LTVVDELPLPAGRVAVVRDAAGTLFGVPAVEGALRRAAPGEGLAESLVASLAAGTRRVGQFELVAWHAEPAFGEEAVTVDQTNESVVVGSLAVVKWIVRPTVGEHPAPHRLALLTAAGFRGMPRPWGLLLWHDPTTAGDEPALLASVAELAPAAQDGWDWAVEDGRAVARGELLAPYDLVPALSLGGLCADLHLALAAAGSRPATADEASSWHTAAVAALDEAIELAAGTEGSASSLLPGRHRAAGLLKGLAEGAGTPLIPVHGDLHVGQVLRSESATAERSRYLLTDFDGSPVLASSERLAPMPAALDVAGMTQSIDHVGRVVVRRTPDVDASVVMSWARRAQASFLDTYRRGLSAAGRSDLLDERLLASFRVQQECREHIYAARHLPHWSYVPEAAMPDLLDELSTDGG